MNEQAEQLCGRAQAGDGAAAAELLTMFYEPIFAWFRRLCGNEADAADLTQKTFCKVWAGLGSFQGRSSFSTWLHGIGRHVYIDWLRQKDPAGPQTEAWWDSRAADTPSPFEDAAERDLARRLYALVEQLAEETREAVHLHYYQGLSLQETADVLGVAASTVKYRLREALEFLRLHTAEPKLRTY